MGTIFSRVPWREVFNLNLGVSVRYLIDSECAESEEPLYQSVPHLDKMKIAFASASLNCTNFHLRVVILRCQVPNPIITRRNLLKSASVVSTFQCVTSLCM